MPELPDVETFRRYFNRTALRQKIKTVEVRSKKITGGATQKTLNRKLRDKAFKSSDRHGKYMFAEFGKEGVMVLHFGMTGFLRYFKGKEGIGPHDKFLVHFKNRYVLAFNNRRLLGKIFLKKNKDDFIKEKKLGPDAYSVDYDTFRRLLRNKKGSVKSALMKQDGISGLGNIYSDEILFQAGAHPKTHAEKLKDNEIENIYKKMKYVLKKAIEQKANPDDLPESFLLKERDKEGKCPRCGKSVKLTKINSRTSYFCSSCQVKK